MKRFFGNVVFVGQLVPFAIGFVFGMVWAPLQVGFSAAWVFTSKAIEWSKGD